MSPSTAIAPSAPTSSSRAGNKFRAQQNARVAKNSRPSSKSTTPAGQWTMPDRIKQQLSTWSALSEKAPPRSSLRRDMRALYWGDEVHEMMAAEALMQQQDDGDDVTAWGRWRAERALSRATDGIGENHTFRTAGLLAEARRAQRNLLLFPDPAVSVDAPDSEAEDALEDAEHLARARRRHRAGDHTSCNPATTVDDMDDAAADLLCDDPAMVDPEDAVELAARVEDYLERRAARECQRDRADREAGADAAWARRVVEVRAAAEAEEHLLLRAPLAGDGDEGLRVRQVLARRKVAFLAARGRWSVRC